MTYDEQSGDYTLSSGRKFGSFTGVIGLSRGESPVLHVGGEKVDTTTAPLWLPRAWTDTRDWTAEERAELADEMILRWTAFKAPQGTHAEQVAQVAAATT